MAPLFNSSFHSTPNLSTTDISNTSSTTLSPSTPVSSGETVSHDDAVPNVFIMDFTGTFSSIASFSSAPIGATDSVSDDDAAASPCFDLSIEVLDNGKTEKR